MKRIFCLVSVVSLLTGLSASGLSFTRTVSKKDLLLENEALRSRADSLKRELDSLKMRNAAEDSVYDVFMRGNSGGLNAGPERLSGQFSPEVTDSLLGMWYRNRESSDFEIMHSYDMDDVAFSSNVPDEEMIRRLENLNCPITLPFNSTVRNYMILYSEKMRGSMGRILGLAKYYFPIFEEAFARYGIPEELKYMAVIESMLVPTATSRAGAKGMWQFMYRTGELYGLRIDSFIDERMDVEKAADAAARYLRDSYSVFGNWALAISSYNCGSGNVNKAVLRAGGKSDFWSIYPYLPRETRGYVPAFVGAMYAMSYANEYGIRAQDVGMPAQVDTFHISRRLYFKQISEVVGIPEDDLRNFNAQYFHDVIPGTASSPCVLRLPFKWTREFVSYDLDSLANYKKDEFAAAVLKGDDESVSGTSYGSKPRARYTTYTVRRGDTLSGIAGRYRGVTVKSIMRYNGLKSTRLRIGQKIRIPR